jgi:hypothetical protein
VLSPSPSSAGASRTSSSNWGAASNGPSPDVLFVHLTELTNPTVAWLAIKRSNPSRACSTRRVIAIEVGLITPPLGIAAFVVKSTLDDQSITLNDVFAGSFPYVLIMILVLILVVIFPQISLVLVR